MCDIVCQLNKALGITGITSFKLCILSEKTVRWGNGIRLACLKFLCLVQIICFGVALALLIDLSEERREYIVPY